MPTPSPLASAAVLLGGAAFYVVLAVAAWRRRPWPAPAWRAAVGLALLALLARLPYQAVSLATLDLSPALDDVDPVVATFLARRVMPIAAVTALLSTGLTALLHLVAAGVAQTADPPAYRPVPTVGLAAALVVGALGAGVLGGLAPPTDTTLHPQLAAGGALAVLWSLSRAMGAAVAAELVWRGAALGLLRQKAPPLAAIGLVGVASAVPGAIGSPSLAFAAGSLVLHTTLTGLAYRWGATSSTLAHLVAGGSAALWMALEAS